ncbi:MAG TPA: serine hydrolase [Candidatus Paceibacterota bacterium]
MEDPVTNNPTTPHTPEIHSSLSAQAAGIVSLVLIFFASASFTWAFLSEGAPQAPVAVAAVVQAAPEPPAPLAVFENVELQSKGAIVVDLTNNRTLYEESADAPLPLASLTKVPLSLVVAETLPEDTIITIPYDTSPYDTMQKLRKGERWRLSDVIDFTLAVSSNTGAEILASAAEEPIREKYLSAPAEDATVWRMNQLVQNVGLTHTYFLNATGLDESTTQAGAYGSARDMALLFAYAADTSSKTFAATTRQSFHLQSLDGTVSTAINTDEALPDIPGLVLGKTGYTELAGGNLAIVFEVYGHRVSAVVLGSTQQGRFDDMKKLVAKTAEALKATE